MFGLRSIPGRSPSDPFRLVAHLFKLDNQPFSLVALNLDPAILDRASGAALLLERGGKFEQARFIKRQIEHWLIDSPKFVTPLVRQLEAGGISHIFLTHQDDVADAERYAEHFESRRIIHRDELSSQPGAEVVLDGAGPWELAPGFLAIPTPGHTKGHCVLLFQDRFLFTGDHLDWDREGQHLSASEGYCWYSWPQQAESMRRLADYRFEWVLPGHGQKVHLPANEMRTQILRLAEAMREG